MEWNPHFKVDMQPSFDEPGAFELVLFADDSTKTISALNHNMRGVSEYRTKDLFKQHPHKPRLWKYYGRRDDIIVLSNGEKFNPVPMELAIQGHPTLAGALIIGQGRSRASLLIEPKADVSEEERVTLVDTIWRCVEEANHLLPAQGRILRGNVLMSQPKKPFTRAGKGTIVRKLTENLYISKIDELYSKESVSLPQELPRLQPAMKPHFEIGMILNFVRAIISNSFPELSGLQDNDDLFSGGLDSVMIGQFLSNLKDGLKDSTPATDLFWLNTRTVYRNSSILRLSNVLAHFLNAGEIPKVNIDQSRISAMEDLVQHYSAGFAKPSTAPKREDNGPHNVALIGSTGYLGPHILVSLLNNPDIVSIYCLNRSADARERTAMALKSIGYREDERFHKVHFLASSLDAPNFGLDQNVFDNLSSKIDTIIYNSWRPNFSLPLHSFEKPFLSGLRNIIDWANPSPKAPRIVFTSSLAAVGNWSKVFPSQTEIPETPITDANVAIKMGYGESKCVGERILQAAHDICGTPVNVIRIGQIGGPSKSSGREWPAQGWLLAIIRTSKAIGALPTQVSPVDWTPVDTLGAQISDIVVHSSTAVGYHVFNLVHPDVAPWDLFLDTLQSQFSIDAEKINLPEWLERLENKAKLDPTDPKRYPALKFSDFLPSMGTGREDMRCKCDNIVKVSQVHVTPNSEELSSSGSFSPENADTAIFTFQMSAQI